MPVLLTLPDFDLPTRFASGYLIRYLANRVEPVQLYGPMSNKFLFRQLAKPADFIFGSGHGLSSSFGGQDREKMIEVGDYDSSVVAGKFIKLLTCQTGKSLGPDMILNGASAFQGYVEDYVFIVDDDYVNTPWNDKLSKLFLMPVMRSMIGVIEGKTNEECYLIEVNGYKESIEVQNEDNDELIDSLLNHNMTNLTMLGNPNAHIRVRPKIFALTSVLPALPMLVPVQMAE